MSITDKIKNYLKEDEGDEEIHLKIFQFFKENSKPSDKQVHSFAESLGIDEHKFEEHIYMIMGSIFAAGKAYEESITEEDVDPEELKMGIKVEMEHTTDPEISKRIALDHLAEIDDYYTRLAKMESEAGVEH